MSSKKNLDEFDLLDRQRAASDEEDEADQEYGSQMSLNRALEKSQRQDKKRGKWRGKAMPLLKNERDDSQDKDPLTPEEVGLNPEDAFLIERKLSPADLRKHQDNHEKDFLGTNMRRSRDFLRMFDKGVSSDEAPKMDFAYNIEYSPNTKKQLIAEQMLRNLQSSKLRERQFAMRIIEETTEGKANEEELEEYEEVDDFRDPDLTDNLIDHIPNYAI